MRVNRSVEHAVIAVLMMAVQAGHAPVKSHVLSGVMGVSDSYLKKTLRKLAAAGVVRSHASKEGGYALARSVSEITLGDVYRAVEPGGFSFRSSPLAEAVFPGGGGHVQESAARWERCSTKDTPHSSPGSTPARFPTCSRTAHGKKAPSTGRASPPRRNRPA